MQHFHVDADDSIYANEETGECKEGYGDKETYESVCGNFKVTVFSTCDHVPGELAEQFTYFVDRGERQATFAEQYLGSGIQTLVDYGRHKENSDQELIDEVKERVLEFDRGPQLTKFLNDDDKFTTNFVIDCNDRGWSVQPVYESEALEKIAS